MEIDFRKFLWLLRNTVTNASNYYVYTITMMKDLIRLWKSSFAFLSFLCQNSTQQNKEKKILADTKRTLEISEICEQECVISG